MKTNLFALAGMILLFASIGAAQAGIATYPDFDAYAIRNGTDGEFTTGVSSDDIAETFTVTAVGGGKVAIGSSAMNGLKVSDFRNFKFSNSVYVPPTSSAFVYPNFWVTDGDDHFAFVAFHAVNETSHVQNDYPVYAEMTSANGMNDAFFGNLGVRVYATDTGNLDWLYKDCVQKVKYGGWSTSLWKSNDDNTFDPVLISDLGDLYFGSPFTTTTVPGISGNAEWTRAGTGDPQMPESFYLMCGDTSGSVENYNYTLSGLELQFVPEPGTLALLAFAGLAALAAAWVRRK